MSFAGVGHCSNGQVYSSRAWALAEQKVGVKAFGTEHYKAWVQAAWQNCLAKDPDVNFVSVWTERGLQAPETSKEGPVLRGRALWSLEASDVPLKNELSGAELP